MKKIYKHKNQKNVFLSIIRIIFFITLLVSVIYIIKWYIDSKQNKMLEEKISEVIVIKNEDYYINTEFKKNEFSEFINTLKNRTIKDFEIEL